MIMPCAGLAGISLPSFSVITIAPAEPREPKIAASAPRRRLKLDISLVCIMVRMSLSSSYTTSSTTMTGCSGLLRICISFPFVTLMPGSLVTASKAVCAPNPSSLSPSIV